MHIWVDRGGTFTDVVRWDGEGPVTLEKIPSDQAVVGTIARGASLVFGTTVATNALLERRGVRTVLLITEGFGDLPTLRTMARHALFDPDDAGPPPLACQIVEVPERMASDGTVLRPLDPAWLHGLRLEDVDAVAIALLHAPRNPSHEAKIVAHLQARAPHLHLAIGSRLSPEVGWLARVETTLLDAAISPVLHAAMRRDAIPEDALAIRSDGTLTPAGSLRAPDAVLSGPAGGVLAVQAIAEAMALPGAVGLDMGGTSTDVCCVARGALPRHADAVSVAGVTVRRPMLEVDTIAAGGGSVLVNDGVQLRVGPSSAGADPGPQCYGRGGPPTLTDAAVALGFVDPQAFTPPLRVDSIHLPGAAEDFVAVAQESMAAAVRTLAARRGLDITPFALVAYGGAAGQHAAGVAERLGIHTVLVHPCAGVLSAWGQTMARRASRDVRAVWLDPRTSWRAICAEARACGATLEGAEDVALEVDLRVAGTDHSITIPFDPRWSVVRARFETVFVTRFGRPLDDAPLQVVNVRAWGWSAAAERPPAPPSRFGLEGQRVHGPRRLDCPTTSVWVPDGWVADERGGMLRLRHLAPRPRVEPTARNALGVALWGQRFMALATEAGEQLARTARSVNIRERRDFSCAVFDPDGRLVANAPHIPVHLGAMGATVRHLLQRDGDRLCDGSMWLSNAPHAGGSHLPDLTVVTPVAVGGHRFFVASRAHHVDVGGISPGSMPPRSRHLGDEGMLFDGVRLPDPCDATALRGLVQESRQPDVVAADLLAQIAANHHAATALRALGDGDLLRAWMAHLQDAAAETTLAHLPRLPASATAETTVGSQVVRVHASRNADGLTMDFAGTDGPDDGNLNAPMAVVRAALLYALRVCIGTDIPLNDGILRHVQVNLPYPSVVHPPEDAAVVGGNVETSQRLVDLFFALWGVRAGSQGTMNNLTFGGTGWSLYETLGGGLGATASHHGQSGRQVHMTNSRATDVEVLEHRLPLRIRRFAIRHGSGGRGRQRGGDGLVREVETTVPAHAALLALSRLHGGAGAAGGHDGMAGCDAIFRDGAWHTWDGDPVTLEPGNRVRIETPGGGGWGPPDD